MRFGFHISIAGGLSRVSPRAVAKGCQTIQIFSRNPRGWNYSPLAQREVESFRSGISQEGIEPVVVHMPYLPNLANPRPEFYRRSLGSLCEDLRRANLLGAQYLVMHVGSSLGASQPEAIKRIVKGINTAFQLVETGAILLLENTAGAGTEIGYRFESFKLIFEGVSQRERIGICLDTAHLFEAGYDLSSALGLEETLNEFDHLIGLGKLSLLHLNDSKTPLGSKSDRHWHIGEGHIGLAGFRRIVNHSKLKDLSGIMETPRKSEEDDLRNMEVIRGLVEK